LSFTRPPLTISTTFSSGFPRTTRARPPNWSGILSRIDRLAIPGLSHIGRPGLAEGTRELVEAPYIVVYEVDEEADEITVLAIVHGARNREG